MITECYEWTDGTDMEMELVKPGVKREAGVGGRENRRSLCLHG